MLHSRLCHLSERLLALPVCPSSASVLVIPSLTSPPPPAPCLLHSPLPVHPHHCVNMSSPTSLPCLSSNASTPAMLHRHGLLAASPASKPGSKRGTVPPYVKAVSGMCGGFVEACSLQPLDVAKTRLQLDHAGKYKGLVHTVRTIGAEEGAAALYKGLTPFVTHLTFKYALRFGAFGYFRTLLPKPEGEGNQAAMNFVVRVARFLRFLCCCCCCCCRCCSMNVPLALLSDRRVWEAVSRKPSSLLRRLRW